MSDNSGTFGSILNNGIAFYELAKSQELEGIVAKRKDSRYYFDKRTKDPFGQRKLTYGMILIIQNIKSGKTSGILTGGKLDFQRIAHERAPLYLVKIGLAVFDNRKLSVENQKPERR